MGCNYSSMSQFQLHPLVWCESNYLSRYNHFLSWRYHYDVIMSAMTSQITNLTIVYSSVYSGAHQRQHQSYASLAFVWGIHRWPVNSPHKGPVTRKMFPFNDVIMIWKCRIHFVQVAVCSSPGWWFSMQVTSSLGQGARQRIGSIRHQLPLLLTWIDLMPAWISNYIRYKVIIKWKHFPRYCPFVWGIHRSSVNSPHKGQWRVALMFSSICLNKRLSKHWWGWWFETPSCPLWRHCNASLLTSREQITQR